MLVIGTNMQRRKIMKDGKVNLKDMQEVNNHGILFEEAQALIEKSIELDYVKDSDAYIASIGSDFIDSCKAEELDSMLQRLIR